MSSYLRRYRPFIVAGIEEATVYRSNFIIYLLGNTLGAFVTYFLWKAVFTSSANSSLNGFTFPEMVLYIFLSFFTGVLTSSDSSTSVGDEVKDGSIAMRILKPINFAANYFYEEIGNKIINLGLLMLPFFGGIVAYQILGQNAPAVNWINILLYFISAIIAYLINFYFNLCFSFTAFFFRNLWGSNLLKNALVVFMSGTLVPLAFFPAVLQNIFKFLPFSSLLYTPVMMYLGKYSPKMIVSMLFLQIFWLVFFIVLSKIIWYFAIKHLSIQGG
ncbi:ABC transporter permease [Companilactobacillus hulinensis]|uniref:ABC transporter permease n=1 Tax=Companilactobacillus hulinensis TaxID=2486007 RepID=UPI000F7A4ED1|nr:ABC-2 family transporter protein [Companilactobacillus hulinensis]